MATQITNSPDKEKALNLVLNQIERSFGKGSIMRLGDATRMKVETISSGAITLDLALGGGLPKGRVIEIYGPESSGKTTLALHTVAEVQKIGGVAAFVDAEHAPAPAHAQQRGGTRDHPRAARRGRGAEDRRRRRLRRRRARARSGLRPEARGQPGRPAGVAA